MAKTSHFARGDVESHMALKIFREIAAGIRSAEFHVTMAGETSDISDTEQLVIRIQWVDDNLNSQEEFIGLHLLQITNDDTIIKVIKHILLRMNISLSKCRS